MKFVSAARLAAKGIDLWSIDRMRGCKSFGTIFILRLGAVRRHRPQPISSALLFPMAQHTRGSIWDTDSVRAAAITVLGELGDTKRSQSNTKNQASSR